ncbi:hypothetical protein TESG_08556 [Trichophyton tonsurans CBS 112818]|uniref:Uncharacterized protein n=1 Tax=Trichophyton tonsurans (strain CBS 112818) TaxID=647933 RepID=F2S5E2_TRIT1|nr:hypothetical protein TESG_08556 [Trichophyton tonsurans CBS 112818]
MGVHSSPRPDRLSKNPRYQRQPRRKTREDRYEPRTGRRPSKTHRQVKRLESGRKSGSTTIKDNFNPPNISQERLTLSVAARGLFRRGRASSPVIRNEHLSFPELNFLSSHSKTRFDPMPHCADLDKMNPLQPSQQNTISKYFSPSQPKNPQHPVCKRLKNPCDLELPISIKNKAPPGSITDPRHSISPTSWSKKRPRNPNSCRKRTLSEVGSSIAGSEQSTTYYTWSRTNSKISSSDPKEPCQAGGVSGQLRRSTGAGSSQMDSKVQDMLFHNAYISNTFEHTGTHPPKSYSLEGLFRKAAETSPIPYQTNISPSSHTPSATRVQVQLHRNQLPKSKETLTQEPSWRQCYRSDKAGKRGANMLSSPRCSHEELPPSSKETEIKMRSSLGQISNRPWPSVEDIPRPAIYGCPPDYGYTSNPTIPRPRYCPPRHGSYPSDHEAGNDNVQRPLSQGSQKMLTCQSSNIRFASGTGTPLKIPSLQLPGHSAAFSRQYRLYGSLPPFNLPKNPPSETIDLGIQSSRRDSSIHLLDDETQSLRTPSEPDRDLLCTPPSQLRTPSPLQPTDPATPGNQNIQTDIEDPNFEPSHFWKPNKLY